MRAYIDIENSRTQDVDTIKADIVEYVYNKIIRFDISNLKKEELKKLKMAISKKYNYTDIEMFFIVDSRIPEFGPDYEFFIKDNLLVGIYTRKD